MTQTNDDIFKLRELAITRDTARDSLKENLTETKIRIKPTSLLKSAKANARLRLEQRGKTVVESVKSRPAISASVVAATAFAIFHKPIGRFINNKINPADKTKKTPRSKS